MTEEPGIYKSALVFLVESALLGFVAFLIAKILIDTYGYSVDWKFELVLFMEILAAFVPAPLPIFFNLIYSFSLNRLRTKNIMGTTLEKTV